MDTGFKRFLRFPAQFPADFGGVDGVAYVMAGAVLHEGNQIFVARHTGWFFGNEFFQQGADGFDYLDIGFFIVSADIVGFADDAFGNNLIQRAGVVFDKQPVADLHSVAVHGQRFAVERIQNHQWNEFFREVVRTVVVRTVGYDGRQTVGAQPCADEMVAGRLGSGVGAGRGVGRSFGKQIVRAVQIAINFIGGNMVETESFAFFRRHPLPVGTCGFEEVERADDVGLDEFAGGINRAVNVAFGGQVHYGVGLVSGKHAVKFGTVADIDLLEGIAGVV